MQTIGRKGEILAAEHLKDKSYQILERNYRFKKSEIDLVCLHDDLLVFVEVKTRSSRSFGEPESFVSEGQKESILKAAEQYMLDANWKGDLRFDIVAIVSDKAGNEITHLKDAFY